MNENELCRLINQRVAQSIGKDDSYRTDNKEYLDYYNSELFGDEEEGRSTLVSNDTSDLVDADESSLARVILGAEPPVTFEPINGGAEALKESEQMNKYIPWLLANIPGSYKKQMDLIKTFDLQDVAAVEFGVKDCKRVESKRYLGISREELQVIINNVEQAEGDSKKVSITSEIETGKTNEFGQTFDFEASIKTERKEFFIENIDWEDFIATANTQTLDEADIVGKRFRLRRGDLVAMGIDRDKVSKMPTSQAQENDWIKEDRFQEQGGLKNQSNDTPWASQYVTGYDVYVRVPDEEDESLIVIRHVIKSDSADVLLMDEPFDIIPYAAGSAINMPGSLVGQSRAKRTISKQRFTSVLQRHMANNIYEVGLNRVYYNDEVVNEDDLNDADVNGNIRVKGSPVGQVMPDPVPYTGDRTLQVIQYADAQHAKSVGSIVSNQALSSDQLHKETATRFEGLEKAATAKIGLVARNLVELIYKPLYEGLAWFARHYQDTEQEVYILGSELNINPSSWRFEHNVVSMIGSDDEQQTLQALSGILGLQQGEIEKGSGLADSGKVYNTIREILRVSNIKGAQRFFNDPAQPNQLVQAENEMLKRIIQDMKVQISNQNPLAEAERVKQETEVLKAQLKADQTLRGDTIKATQVANDYEIDRRKLAQSDAHHGEDMTVKLTELELENNTDVPGGLV